MDAVRSRALRHRPCLLAGIAMGLAATSPVRAVTNRNPATACELLSTTEVAAFLKVPSVHIDSLNSGKNELTAVDRCSWYVREGSSEGVMLKLRRADSPGAVSTEFLAARIDEGFSRPGQAASMPGVGEEAQYLPYPDGHGGTIIVRKGQSVVTLIGSASKETLVSMAKAVIPRLGE